MAKFSQYQVFVAIVETGSLSSAARLLNITPSAVSKQLAMLESSIDAQLFDRSNRNLKVTEAGEYFYRQCKEVLFSVQQAEEGLRSIQGEVSGKLSLTLSKSLARSWLFDLLSKFSDQYPAIRFDFNLTDEVKDLHEQNIDFAFRLGRIADSTRLVAKPLIQVTLIYCISPLYIAKKGKPESLESLSDHQVILPSPKNFSWELREFFKREKLQINPEKHHTTNDIEAVHQSVHSGLAIGMMLDISVQEEMEQGTFVNLFPNLNLPSKKLYLVYKKSEHFSQKQTLFKNFISNAPFPKLG